MIVKKKSRVSKMKQQREDCPALALLLQYLCQLFERLTDARQGALAS